MSDLEKSILATIAFYDVLDRPLTGFEVFKYLIKVKSSKLKVKSIKFFDVLNILENSQILKEKIEEKQGFYFLNGKKDVVSQRIEKQKIAERKWKKIKKAAQWFWLLPCLRGVFVNGSLAQNNTKEESDLDLLVIAKAGRIWTLRSLFVILTEIMGKRRRFQGKETKDKICLNHYITEKSLNLPFRNLADASTHFHLIPLILDVNSEISTFKNIFDKFWLKNKWVRDYLEFFPEVESRNQRIVKPNKFLLILAKIGEILLNSYFGNWLEKKLAKFQTTRIKKRIYSKEKGRIITDDTQLIFHPDSPEKKIIEQYNKNILKLGLSDLLAKDF